jgi:DNA-binding phage protein
METERPYLAYRHDILKKAITRDTDIKALCERIQISRPTFYRAVNGMGARIKNVRKVADALGVPHEELFYSCP